MRLKQLAAPLRARITRLVPHLVPHREPNDPIKDQSWDGQIEQKYQAVSDDHADLTLSIRPPVDPDCDGTVAHGCGRSKSPLARGQAAGGAWLCRMRLPSVL